jgi:hypothetical protein
MQQKSPVNAAKTKKPINIKTLLSPSAAGLSIWIIVARGGQIAHIARKIHPTVRMKKNRSPTL